MTMTPNERTVFRYLTGRKIGRRFGFAIESDTPTRIAKMVELPPRRVRTALAGLRQQGLAFRYGREWIAP